MGAGCSEINRGIVGDEARLAALVDLAILDTAPDRELDTICEIAASSLKAPSSGISLVARDRQWFKARHNIALKQTSLDEAFCAHVVAQRNSVVVLDATQDARFAANPLVTGEPHIRFYAGAPIILASGYCVGSLCVIDSEPRTALDEGDLRILEQLAKLAAQIIEKTRDMRFTDLAGKIIETVAEAIIAVDRTGTIIYLNRAAEEMFGYSDSELIGQHVRLITAERYRADQQQMLEDAAAGQPTQLDETAVKLLALRHDGTEFPAVLTLAPWSEGDEQLGYAAIVRDDSERRAMDTERRRSRAFLDGILENLPLMLFVKDARSRRYEFVNKKMEEVAGTSAEKMIGASDSELFPDVGEGFENRDKLARQSPRPFIYESKFERSDGAVLDIRTTRVIMEGPDRKDQYILGIGEDLTSTRLAEAENYRLARYDTLTGLLNRDKLAELLQDLMASSDTRFALLSIDLDRFKSVNDQFGHLAGDEVLKQVGQRIEGAVESEDFTARVGGDEFMAILVGNDVRRRARRIAASLIKQVQQPMTTARGTAHLGASIGIAVYPDDAQTSEKLRENADLALYRAKKRGRGMPCFFDDAMDAAVRDRRKLEKELRRAVDEQRIGLVYQPVVSSATGRITSVEALARWTHPKHGAVGPDRFISLAEDCGLIDQLGEQLLQIACADACTWSSHVRVAVNLSPLQFRSSKLLKTVERALKETGLDPNRLQLEVTERLVLQNVEHTFAQLEALRALGIHILIDDFGVGNSSLSYFQRFPFDKVKIDKSFVSEVEASQTSKAIIEAVVGLGKQLDMGIVAEGVETPRQQLILTEMGCTHLQGYLFGKPTDVCTLRRMIEAQDIIASAPVTRREPRALAARSQRR